jgi:hypothetical protein
MPCAFRQPSVFYIHFLLRLLYFSVTTVTPQPEHPPKSGKYIPFRKIISPPVGIFVGQIPQPCGRLLRQSCS